MIAGLLDRLLGTAPEAPSDEDARLALAALMVRIARADNKYETVEKERIDALLRTRYGLAGDEVLALRAEAEEVEAEAPDTVRFTRAIKDAVPHEERLAVLESLWSVVLADDEREQHEDALLRVVSGLLGLTDTESARARQKAAAK
ncbi:TerB family tellurite resistance protein [Rhodobacteraceae bacterium 63075]|nr:TerB family tellurite resistance protein [Rhodobacteraceae bacterium 63075]